MSPKGRQAKHKEHIAKYEQLLAAENKTPVKDSVNNLMPFFSVGKKTQEKLPDKPVRVSYRIVSAN